MKIICSASKGVDEQLDTANLRKLLKFIHKFGGLSSRVVLGHWHGNRELSLEVTGFADDNDAMAFIGWVIPAFNQDAVYYEKNDKAFIVTVEAGVFKTKYIGREVHVEASGVLAIALPESYTEYLDGGITYTRSLTATH